MSSDFVKQKLVPSVKKLRLLQQQTLVEQQQFNFPSS